LSKISLIKVLKVETEIVERKSKVVNERLILKYNPFHLKNARLRILQQFYSAVCNLGEKYNFK
jgi:hypothetical protein